MSILSSIEAAEHSMSPALQAVAREVRADPSSVLELTITDFAARCETSVASIVRFCRAIGVAGYAQLRLQLASELGRESAQFGTAMTYGADIAAGDSVRDMVAKISSLEALAIEETASGIAYDALGAIVDAVDRAERVLLFGVGASRFVAEDLQHKLFRIGRAAFLLSEPDEAMTAASLATSTTVAIAFSHLGRTPDVIEFVRLAQGAGAVTVGITGVAESELAHQVDHVLVARARETEFRAGAMVSRIAHLLIVDCIFLGVAQSRRDETVEALRRTREATLAVRRR
ncbi:MAG TPA: MurR/RpiR family transcriptional regulator [Gryllotalpicola sp.]